MVTSLNGISDIMYRRRSNPEIISSVNTFQQITFDRPFLVRYRICFSQKHTLLPSTLS